jgi:cytochrome c oxidase subunit 2
VQKLWSFLFLLVPIFCVLIFIIAPSQGWWLPENVSNFGGNVDHLFMVILWIVTVAFIGTQAALVYFLFKYGSHGGKAKFIHTDHRLEFWWTIIPAGILVFIAFYQFNTWIHIKGKKIPRDGVDAEVLAGQFEWRIRYPGPDGKIGTQDDIQSLNNLHVPVNEDFTILLRSRDVLHSFFLPNLRVKQDAVPGMEIPVWFHPTKEGDFDLFCAELCGWGHYKMRGMLTVQSRSAYDQWLTEQKDAQDYTGFEQASTASKAVTEVSQ